MNESVKRGLNFLKPGTVVPIDVKTVADLHAALKYTVEQLKEALDTLEKAYVLQEIDDIIPKDAPIKQTVNRLRQAIEQSESITQITQNHYSNEIEWVGLTQQDIDIAFDDTQEGGGFNEFARAIEQTLRRKNK